MPPNVPNAASVRAANPIVALPTVLGQGIVAMGSIRGLKGSKHADLEKEVWTQALACFFL